MPVWPKPSTHYASRRPGGPIVGEVVVWRWKRAEWLQRATRAHREPSQASLAVTTDPPCVLCRTEAQPRRCVYLTHGVSIWLCRAHGSDTYQRRRGGAAFCERLAAVWRAAGSLTSRRLASLVAHQRRISEERHGRDLPGSYSWPELRRDAEERFARGDDPRIVIRELSERYATGPARPPTERTMRRWFAQSRWRQRPQGAPRGHRTTPRRQGYREVRIKAWPDVLLPWAIARHLPGASVRYVKWPPP